MSVAPTTPTHPPTKQMAEDNGEERPPVDNNEVAPTDPAPLADPPWVGASIDTNVRNQTYYMPAERGLGHFTTQKE
eukprot:15366266-Heterocapsa_arctica.AAC.1